MKRRIRPILLICLFALCGASALILCRYESHSKSPQKSTTYLYKYEYGASNNVLIYDKHDVFIYELEQDLRGLGTENNFGEKSYYDENGNLIRYICPYSSEGTALYSFTYDESDRIESMYERVLIGTDFNEEYHVIRRWCYEEDGYSVTEYATDYCNYYGEKNREYLSSLITVRYVGDEIITEKTSYDPEGNVEYTSQTVEPREGSRIS